MCLDRRQNLELAYEQGLQKINTEHYTVDEFQILSWLRFLEVRQFELFYSIGEKLSNSLKDPELKNFVCIWLIIGSEVQFNTDKRQIYISRLNSLSEVKFDPFTEFYKVYFYGVGLFYEGRLLESQTVNDKAYFMATAMKIERAQARCLYQKSIIQFDLGNKTEAFKNLKDCLEICSRHNFVKTQKKAFIEFYSQSSIKPLVAKDIDVCIYELQILINNKEEVSARKLLAQAEKLRKINHYARSKYSLYFYRAQICILGKKLSAARRIINRLNDAVLQVSLYEFMLKNDVLLTEREQTKLKINKLHLGQIQFGKNTDSLQSIESIQVLNIKNIDVRNLITLLLQNQKPLTKERLIRALYKYDYDPTLHDNKLYKLILRARKEVSTDLIINHYGHYSLNLKKYKIVI